MRDYHNKPCSFYIIGENGEKLYGPGIPPTNKEITNELIEMHETTIEYLQEDLNEAHQTITALYKVIDMLVDDGKMLAKELKRVKYLKEAQDKYYKKEIAKIYEALQ